MDAREGKWTAAMTLSRTQLREYGTVAKATSDFSIKFKNRVSWEGECLTVSIKQRNKDHGLTRRAVLTQ